MLPRVVTVIQGVTLMNSPFSLVCMPNRQQWKKSRNSKSHCYLFQVLILLFSSCSVIFIYSLTDSVSQQTSLHTSPLHVTPRPARKVVATEHASNFEGVHVVQTRFMQHQPHLLTLGLARLALFETFCLPTILSQTNQNFLWILRADPNLNPELRQNMMKLLGGRPNFIFMGSNYNRYGFSRGNTYESFDDYVLAEKPRKENKEDLGTPAAVWSGNFTLLREAYERLESGQGVILETRLDADDGLHHDFVKTIQEEAIRYLTRHGKDVSKKESDENWRVWCVDSNVQWHPIDPYPNSKREVGFLKKDYDKVCVTPGKTVIAILFSHCPRLKMCSNFCCSFLYTQGLTYGLGAAVNMSSIPIIQHHKLLSILTKCDISQKKRSCVDRIKSLDPGAIRSRTITSAGMNNVFSGQESQDGILLKEDHKKQQAEQDALWRSVNDAFRISHSSMVTTRKLLLEYGAEIAEENLSGQCLPGAMEFSCKKEAKSSLISFLERSRKQKVDISASSNKYETLARKCKNSPVVIQDSNYKSQSGEDKMLLQWFSNICGGSYIEMGALDGVKYSNSYVFHEALEWKGVLIELMKDNYEKLVVNRPDEIATIHAGVCDHPQKIHFVHGKTTATGGIYEFVSPSFRKKWWGNISLDDDSRVVAIDCNTLDNLLIKNVPEVNFFDFFSLDVEGSELAVLKSIDFDRVGFGIILVEADGHNQLKNLASRALLESNGYFFLQESKRSHWFVNRDFHTFYKDLVY